MDLKLCLQEQIVRKGVEFSKSGFRCHKSEGSSHQIWLRRRISCKLPFRRLIYMLHEIVVGSSPIHIFI